MFSLLDAHLLTIEVHTPFVLLHSAQRDHSILEDLCRKVYFPIAPYSKGEITLMNGFLSFIFAEYQANPDSSLPASDCATYAKLCEDNFITGLQDFDCLVTPTLENIQCLMIGVCVFQILNTSNTHHSPGYESSRGVANFSLLDFRFCRSETLSNSWIPPRSSCLTRSTKAR